MNLKKLLFIVPLLTLLAAVFLVAQTEIDPDGDGIPDVFESFFGLEGDIAAPDADPDMDGSNNFYEKTAWTDPLNPDTDLDGFADSIDAVPVSRALWFWGEPRFTYGVTNAYTRPAWAGDGLAFGGSHVEYPGFGHAWALETGAGFLLMPLDRNLVSNELWIAVAAVTEGVMAVDMLDSNLVEISTPVTLAPAGDVWFTNRLSLAEFPEAHFLSLYVTQGVAHVFASMLYVDSDGDGYDDDQELQLEGPDAGTLGTLLPTPMTSSLLPASTNAILAQAPFVWRLGFETSEGYTAGPVNGMQGWTASNGVEVVTSQAAEGSQSLKLNRSLGEDVFVKASRAIPSSVSTNVVWVSLKTKLVPYGADKNADGSAAFALEGDRVCAYDGVTRRWICSTQVFPGITNRWARMDVRLDFDTKTYTLCCEGVATHRDLGFADPTISRLNEVEAKNGHGGDAGIDAMVVTDREPEGLDFDADGLPNAQELTLGTDLWGSDTDGDTIPDTVEIANGWDPLVHNTDPDMDGMTTDIENGRFGTDPAKTDSDNDGIPDLYTVADLAGSAFTAKSGSWTVEGSAVIATEGALLRLTYDVTLPYAGFHLVTFNFSNVTASAAVHTLTLTCDDAVIATFSAPINGATSWQTWTPWLPAGTNRFRLCWTEDAAAGRKLSVLGLRVQGVDSGAAACQLWCGLNPGTADRDVDGLTDVIETGTSTTLVTRVDSDGGLLWDGDERSIFMLDPNAIDSDNNSTNDGIVASSRAGIDTATRYVTHITTDFTQSGDSLVWANNTASSIAYDLTVETPGFHVLEIQARNFQYDPPKDYRFTFNASLLDRSIGSISVAGDIDRAGKGRIITPWLPAGVHRFKIAWANRAVSGSRISRPALDSIRLIAVNGVDADNDGIQDWMETRLAAATADSDGDGILDRDEVRVRGSNPLNTDTDFDGLNDKEEITLGTSLVSVDTDGDGVNDKEETRIGTSPLTQSFGSAWAPIAVKTGAEVDKVEGPLFRDGAMLVAHARGVAEYLISMPSDDKPVLRVTGRHEWRGTSGSTPITASDFIVYADGQFVGRYWFRDADGSFDAVLPYMKAGTKRIRLVWNAVDANLGLRIGSVALGTLGGTDMDNNGVVEWIASSAAVGNRVFLTAIASPLSPVCVEGSARWPELVAGMFNGTTALVKPATSGRWYADLTLNADGSALPFDIAFENGANTASVAVAWTPLDLVTGVANLNARVGDTLRLGISQEGSALITATDPLGQVFSTNTLTQSHINTLLDVPLNIAGTWTFTTVWTPVTGSPVTRTLKVNVYGGALPVAAPACQLGRARSWAVPGLTAGAKLEAAAGLTVTLSGTNATLTASSTYMDHYITLRAGTGGPILDSRRAAAFWVQSAVDSFINVIETRPTSQVWEGRLVTFGVPVDAEIELRIFAGGVTFDDLSIVRRVSGASLPQAGEYFYRQIHPNSVSSSTCHTIRSYQYGMLLGDSYSGGVGLPNDLKQPIH